MKDKEKKKKKKEKTEKGKRKKKKKWGGGSPKTIYKNFQTPDRPPLAAAMLFEGVWLAIHHVILGTGA